jgi:hypothetical protein
MRGLKIMVIVMGVMLVAGIAALGLGIAYRVNHPRGQAPSAPHAIISPNGTARTVMLPSGAKILGVQSDGGYVMIRLGLANGGEELILVDWQTGRRLSTLDLK